jgi:L-ascorbate metabolism protein UlaG (beta-lactamase superfamily)
MIHPKFGKAPAGERLERIKKSPNYKGGKFDNQHFTPQLTEGTSVPKMMYEFFFKKNKRRIPVGIIPSAKTDLLNLPANENVLVWFGHSSYFMQVDGKKFLIDPVFSGNASPIPNTMKSFKGTEIYSTDDIPEIDFLIMTHDHYDHMDYETIIKLKPKIKKIITGLGVGSHFEYWGFKSEIITELDWYDKIDLGQGFILNAMPARHFSGRAFSRNNTLWISLVLKTPSFNLYLGGDSGYDTHYAEIGNQFGPFDLAILDNGQFDLKWKYIHNHPHETLQAAKDLKAKRLLPVHSSKFPLSNHAWDHLLKTITSLNEKSENPVSIITPMIGEKVFLGESDQKFINWWEGVE